MTKIQNGNITVSTNYKYSNFHNFTEYMDEIDRLQYDLRGGNFAGADHVLEKFSNSVIDYAIRYLTIGGHTHKVSDMFWRLHRYPELYPGRYEPPYLEDRESFKIIPGEDGGRKSVSITNIKPYAGHIEYGFTHNLISSHPFIGPFPFMRPALKNASAESTGDFEEYLKESVLLRRNTTTKERYKMNSDTSSFVNRSMQLRVGSRVRQKYAPSRNKIVEKTSSMIDRNRSYNRKREFGNDEYLGIAPPHYR